MTKQQYGYDDDGSVSICKAKPGNEGRYGCHHSKHTELTASEADAINEAAFAKDSLKKSLKRTSNFDPSQYDKSDLIDMGSKLGPLSDVKTNDEYQVSSNVDGTEAYVFYDGLSDSIMDDIRHDAAQYNVDIAFDRAKGPSRAYDLLVTGSHEDIEAYAKHRWNGLDQSDPDANASQIADPQAIRQSMALTYMSTGSDKEELIQRKNRLDHADTAAARLVEQNPKASKAMSIIARNVDVNHKGYHKAVADNDSDAIIDASWKASYHAVEKSYDDMHDATLHKMVDDSVLSDTSGSSTRLSSKTALRAIALDLHHTGYLASSVEAEHSSEPFKTAVNDTAKQLGLSSRQQRSLRRIADMSTSVADFDKMMDNPDMRTLCKNNSVPVWNHLTNNASLADVYAKRQLGVSGLAKLWASSDPRRANSTMNPTAPRIEKVVDGSYAE
jgi:hypothetical protein